MTRLINTALVLGFVAAAGLAAWNLAGVGRELAVPMAPAGMTKSYAGSTPAPEFPAGMDWINTGGETLTLKGLRGKVVLLDFWTYGCANCMHVIPDLERLEHKYAKELVVIGVHSAKFANEGRTSQIRKIVQRYELKHPVLNDQFMKVWDAYSARAWPTLMVIDPAGNAVGQVAGEGHYELLDSVIGALVAEFRDLPKDKGGLDLTPFALRPDALPATPLRFPGKVLADAFFDEKGGRLFISDSNHDRIIVAGLDGTVRQVIGGGRGFKDGAGFPAKGAAPAARFHGPQGLALADANTLYVADTHNDAIRRVDLRTGAVSTVAGTGAHGYMRGDSYPARETTLNTPWDLVFHQGQLYIAMAGQHQLWRYDPKTQRLARHAGSGYEALEDGPLADAGMNQPSGLATDGQRLFVADAEASAVRVADFDPEGKLSTLVGTGLFDFGDIDGVGDAVRLQHLLGVAWLADQAGGKLFIADTYNGKLKVLDPRTRSVTTLSGGLDEPGGLSVLAVPGGAKVYIADTNHHAIKVYDLATRTQSELTLKGL